MKTVAVVGASSDRHKYGNKAVRAFLAQGYRVVPINPGRGLVEGLETFASVLEVPFDIDMATLYVPPAVGERLVEQFAEKRIPEVWLTPGSESEALVARAKALGITPIMACSIMGIGDSPARY